jgi:hypothetical protein
MNNATAILLGFLLLPFSSFSQGTSCGSSIPLTLDGTLRTYSASSTTQGPVVCTNYTASSPVTWFSFSTNGTGACPLISIHALDNQQCEIALYTSCSGNMSNNLQSASGMCFDDGEGLWAPSETFFTTANTTYYLRVKTSTACTISLSAQSHTPSNDDCLGATSISTTAITDNNACHHGGPGVTPVQLCASTLENTAFYQYYVAATGPTILNISSISCDNGDGNNRNGFQIGFFSGSCGALTPLSCDSGSGSFVQATTPSLPANTKVFVAVDGFAGSNCQYSISGLNIYGVLAAEDFKNFSAWKTSASNVLKWISTGNSRAFYDVERSADGKEFTRIGRVYKESDQNNQTDYNFEDKDPVPFAYYRIKMIGHEGTIALSQIITLSREVRGFEVTMQNPVRESLNIKIQSDAPGTYRYFILNVYGQTLSDGSLTCPKGVVRLTRDISKLSSGKYFFLIGDSKLESTTAFIKMN